MGVASNLRTDGFPFQAKKRGQTLRSVEHGAVRSAPHPSCRDGANKRVDIMLEISIPSSELARHNRGEFKLLSPVTRCMPCRG